MDKKTEALERMKILKLSNNVIKDFKDNNVVYYSERQNAFFDGILYWVSNNEDYVKAIKEFETKNKALVYHAQLTHFEFGDCLSLLYVSNEEGEWESEKQELKSGYAFSYVINLDDSTCSEFGTIGIAPKNGGVTRTA